MAGSTDPDRWAEDRARMVAEQLVGRGIRQREVLDALARVPRERFVDPAVMDRAYDDAALGIADGQTISQPYIVARMTEELDLPGWRARHSGRIPRVLDVGTGSGYQAAVLAAMGARVIGVERHASLAAAAEERLRGLRLTIRVVIGDGSEGWPDEAPYAAIVVAAAAPQVPPPLIDQLADDGRLVVPVGTRMHQELRVVRRTGSRVEWRSVEPCVFVPLVGRFGFPPER
jgi:protein-L-isoaspartate(D-aspartate) O-methyltransferase